MTTTQIAEQAIEEAKAALVEGSKSSEYTIKIKGYRNTVATLKSPEHQASEIIEAALSAVFAVYQQGGEYDEVAGDLLENFARENRIAYLCGVKE